MLYQVAEFWGVARLRLASGFGFRFFFPADLNNEGTKQRRIEFRKARRAGIWVDQRVHFRHSFQSLSVASAMTSAAWRSHFDFRCGKSRRVPRWTLASSRP